MVACRLCGFDSPVGLWFCGKCGQALTVVACGRCGYPNPPEFTYCGQCGTPLEVETTDAASVAPLSQSELEHLRRYLPSTYVEALGYDPAHPTEELLQEGSAFLAQLFTQLAAHLPAYLRERLAAHPSAETVGGRFVQGALLFSDVSGFTAMSEKLSQRGREGAEEITAIINRYFTRMQRILRACGGQLIQFGGDALLGLFLDPHGTAHAVAAGLAMQAAMQEFGEIQTSQGEFPLQMKVGLHHGQFFDAQLGTAHHMTYALFGADVNATAAAESAAQAGQVLITRAARAQLPAPAPYTFTPIQDQYFSVTSPEPLPPLALSEALTGPLLGVEATLSGLRTAVARLNALVPYLPAGLLARVTGGGQTQEGEHRLVSMMFINVHGLGDLADQLGPGHETQIVAALNHYLVTMDEALRQYGGVLNKIDLYDHGDKLMAFFGAPVAHEDDAERAIHAALAMQAALPEVNARLPELTGLPRAQLRQRIGISYGYVFAGYVGARWRREYTVMGDAVNLAARLMAVAQAAQIIVPPSVQQRAEALFNLEAQGEVHLKGKAAPVPIYAVRGVQANPQPRQTWHGVRSPLVGRRVERARLGRVMEELRAGRGQVALVIGEAGQGKSRLLDEVKNELWLQPGGGEFWAHRWVEGRCLSYTETVSYWPFQEVVRQLLDLKAEATPAEARAQVQTRLEQRLAAEPAALALPYLLHFLGLPLAEAQQEKVRYLDAEGLHRRTLLALTSLIEASARLPHGPLVIVLEDIHWLDQASRALLEQLLPLVNRVPLLWAFLFRPERAKAGWQVREKALRELTHCTTEIALMPLTTAESHELLVNLTQVVDWPAEAARFLERTEGNPLYLEELVRTLLNENALWQDAQGRWQVHHLESVTVPDTLQGMLMARLDLLAEPPRQTAQVASVIGRLFSFDVLAYTQGAVAPEAPAQLSTNLAELQQHEIIYESQRAPHLIYTFKHGMMQEVYYASLLARVSRQHHCSIAEYLEAHTDAESNAALIAFHAFQGQDWARALRYQLRAGEQAKRLFANQEALEHLTRTLHCAEHLPPADTAGERLAAHLALGELLTTLGKFETAREHLRTARDLAHESQATRAEASACHWLARSFERTGEYPLALEWIQTGRAALQGAETSEQVLLVTLAGLVYSRLGDKDNALEYCDTGLRLAAQLGEITTLARAHVLRGHLERLRGANVAAVTHFQHALALYQKVGDLAGQATAHNQLGNAYFDMSQWTTASQAYLQSRQVFDQMGDVYNRAFVESNLGEIALYQGRLDEALLYYQSSLRSLEQTSGTVYVLAAVNNNVGASYLRRGELDAGLRHLNISQQLFEQIQSRDFLPELNRHFAEAAMLQQDWRTAEDRIQQGLALAQEMEMQGEVGIAHRMLGEIHLAQKNFAAAASALHTSLQVLTALHDSYQLARTQLVLAQTYAAEQKTAAAHAQLAACRPVFERLEAALDLAAARTLQAQLPPSPP